MGGTRPGCARAVVIDFLASPGPFDRPDPRAALTPEMVRNAAASGITAVKLTVGGGGSVEENVRTIVLWEREVQAHPDVLARVRTLADLSAAKETRRLGLIYGFPGRRGVRPGPVARGDLPGPGGRAVQLTYLIGDGCLEPANVGLSRLGRDLMAELDWHRLLRDIWGG